MDFFHLDALSSAVRLKVDFDVTLTEAATGLHRMLGRLLPGYEAAKSRQLMRRTHASLGHHAKVDPKVSADQRGHGIGVALDVYTQSSIEDMAAAGKQLEESVLTGVVRGRKRSA